LSVDVENGWVTVSGTVDLPYQRTCAEFDARSVPGVVGVTNLIRLTDAQRAGRRADQVAKAATEYCRRSPAAESRVQTDFNMPPST
jgi:hypothetical protein